MTIDDGVIKYDNSSFEKTEQLSQGEIQELEAARHEMYKRKLIGEYPTEKIGYGNISQRQNYLHLHKTQKSQFVISGSQTGHLEHLTTKHYSRVLDFDLTQNQIVAQGPVNASSESLTHAAIYECSSLIQNIIHIHHLEIWKAMIRENYASTAKEIPYGTPEMARATQECVGNLSKGIFVMEGHHEGVVAFGENFTQSLNLIFDVYRKFVG